MIGTSGGGRWYGVSLQLPTDLLATTTTTAT
jgi:hypothetical protein